ncbi:MAG: DIP1984 family protein [Nitrososphaerales archaeon]
MKLYEALSMRKSLELQLTQLISIRDHSLEYPEEEIPEFDFNSLPTQIKEVVTKLSKLKVEIARANMDTALSNGQTLFESIIELANLRSPVAQLKDMMQVERRGLFGNERRSKQDVKTLKQRRFNIAFYASRIPSARMSSTR